MKPSNELHSCERSPREYALFYQPSWATRWPLQTENSQGASTPMWFETDVLLSIRKSMLPHTEIQEGESHVSGIAGC